MQDETWEAGSIQYRAVNSSPIQYLKSTHHLYQPPVQTLPAPAAAQNEQESGREPAATTPTTAPASTAPADGVPAANTNATGNAGNAETGTEDDNAETGDSGGKGEKKDGKNKKNNKSKKNQAAQLPKRSRSVAWPDISELNFHPPAATLDPLDSEHVPDEDDVRFGSCSRESSLNESCRSSADRWCRSHIIDSQIILKRS